MPRCSFCDSEFESQQKLTYHAIECRQRPDEALFECQICGNKYDSKDSIKEHLDDCADQPSTTIHTCTMCGSEFDDARDLITHKRSCTGESTRDGPTESSADEVLKEDLSGLVVFYNPEGGYGFIQTDDLKTATQSSSDGESGDVFFHESNYPGDQAAETERLQFDVKQGDEGYEAINISVIERQKKDVSGWEKESASDRVQWGRDT